jgi:hypothetical protein
MRQTRSSLPIHSQMGFRPTKCTKEPNVGTPPFQPLPNEMESLSAGGCSTSNSSGDGIVEALLCAHLKLHLANYHLVRPRLCFIFRNKEFMAGKALYPHYNVIYAPFSSWLAEIQHDS